MAATAHRGPPIIALVGPTASGKTEVSVALAERFGAHIVNYDSVQLYRGLEVGACKPSPELRERYPHHLFDAAGPGEDLSAGQYADLARALLEDLLSEEERIVLVGGTGLYLRALLHGLAGAPATEPAVRDRLARRFEGIPTPQVHAALARVDPALAGRLQPNDRQRITRGLEVFEQTGRPLSQWQREHGFARERFEARKLGLASERETLYKRIDRRSGELIEQGLLAETGRLIAAGYDPEGKALGSIGYRQAVEHLRGDLPAERLSEEIARQTRRYAKRQLTWFRREPGVSWLDPAEGPGPFVDAAESLWKE